MTTERWLQRHAGPGFRRDSVEEQALGPRIETSEHDRSPNQAKIASREILEIVKCPIRYGPNLPRSQDIRAALAMERGYILYSTGAEFAPFSALRWVDSCKGAKGS
jgi:hypothetical protein